MNIIRGVLALLLGLMLAGCATPPPDADPFSLARLRVPAADEVVLVVYREFSPPAMYKFTVRVNASAQVDLPTEGFAVVTTQSGPVQIGVTYPDMAMIKPTSFQASFAGGTVHFLELVGDIASVSLPGPLVRLSGGVVEKPAAAAVPQLTRCCRQVPVLAP